MTIRPYPRPIHRNPTDLDADIRNGTHARKTRAHAQAVTAWWNQPRPPLGRHHPTFPQLKQPVAA